MSTRRVLLGSVAIVAAFATAIPLATAAAKPPKAGDRCTPAQVGKKSGALTCVKNGSLRRWEAAKSAPAVLPEPGHVKA